jgi:hypothetical protein
LDAIGLGDVKPVLERKFEVNGDGDSGEFRCIATHLPIRKWRHVIPFLRMTRQVQKQLRQTQGLARYSLKPDFLRKRFWTLTVWQKKEFVQDFVIREPHAQAVQRFKDWAGEGAAFVEWTSTDGSLDWNTAIQKLQNPTFYYRK